jgi:hypothetical protein
MLQYVSTLLLLLLLLLLLPLLLPLLLLLLLLLRLLLPCQGATHLWHLATALGTIPTALWFHQQQYRPGPSAKHPVLPQTMVAADTNWLATTGSGCRTSIQAAQLQVSSWDILRQHCRSDVCGLSVCGDAALSQDVSPHAALLHSAAHCSVAQKFC